MARPGTGSGSSAPPPDAYHAGAAVWVADPASAKATPSGRKAPAVWLQGTVTALEGEGSSLALTVDVGGGRSLTAPAADCPLQNSRDDTLDDLVRADFLHEPGYEREGGRSARRAMGAARRAGVAASQTPAQCGPRCGALLAAPWRGLRVGGGRGRATRSRPPAAPRPPSPPSILHTLRVRYELDMIYTYSGNILIAVRDGEELAARRAATTAAARSRRPRPSRPTRTSGCATCTAPAPWPATAACLSGS